MKKALFVTHMLERNGAPMALLHMIDRLLAEGYTADALSMYDGPLREDLQKRGISTEIIENPLKDSDAVSEKMSRYDLVVCNTLITLPFVLLMNGTGVPTLWWIHEGESYFEKYKNALSKIEWLTTNIKIAAVSPTVCALVQKYGKQTPALLPFSVPEPEMTKKLRDWADEIWSDEERSKLRLLLVGPLSYMKGQDIFIDALYHLKRAEAL